VSLAEEAHKRALELDLLLESQIPSVELGSSVELLRQLRAYLEKQDRVAGTGNNVMKLLKQVTDRSGKAQINLGMPSKDRSSEAFVLRSGSRLNFGITVQENGNASYLLAYRFQVQLPQGHSPQYLRFELIPKQHDKPLQEARCHLHPGARDMRIPLPVLSPFEILDRVFFVVEPNIV
jgi:hypothetical protein